MPVRAIASPVSEWVGRGLFREIPDYSSSVDTLSDRSDMLSDIDRKILDFERAWWRYPEPKVCTIRQLLGLDAADYYRRLGELMTTPEANTYDPLTVRRLVRWLGTGAA